MADTWKSFSLWWAWLCCWTLDDPWPLSQGLITEGWRPVVTPAGSLWSPEPAASAQSQPEMKPIEPTFPIPHYNIQYIHHWKRSLSSSQASEVNWLANTVIEIQKNVKMESEIYLTKQTLILWLSALIPWCFLPEVSRFILLLCFSKPCFLLSLHHLPTLSSPADPTNMLGSNGHGNTLMTWGARLAPVGPDAFLHYPCSLMQRTPLKALYKVQRAWTTTIEIWDERSAGVINHLSINHCHPCCSESPAGHLRHLED